MMPYYYFHTAKHVGIIETIFSHNVTGASQNLVLIRCLDVTEPDQRNTVVVHNFGNRRYRYRVSSAGCMTMTLVTAKDLLGPILLVVDPYWLKQEHGLRHRFGDICVYDALQRTLRFFLFQTFNIFECRQITGSTVPTYCFKYSFSQIILTVTALIKISIPSQSVVLIFYEPY